MRKYGLLILLVLICSGAIMAYFLYQSFGHQWIISLSSKNAFPVLSAPLTEYLSQHPIKETLLFFDQLFLTLIYGLFLGPACFVVILLFAKRSRYVEPYDHHSTFLSTEIFLASALCLFFELAIIRYQASKIPLFAYFKNVSLLSAFLGLGIGFTRGKKNESRLPLFMLLLSAQILLFYALRSTRIRLPNPIMENLSFIGDAARITESLPVFAIMGVFYILNAIAFIPLGQFTSHLMIRKNPLVAYGLNLLGSLAGIIFFSLLSFMRTPPAVWFGAGFLVIIWFLRVQPQKIFLSILITAFVISLEIFDTDVMVLRRLKIYSPYQLIVCNFDNSHNKLYGSTMYLTVNHDYFQKIFDLSNSRPDAPSGARESRLDKVALYYEFPYLFHPDPADVLIVGAGTGNDVAAGLRRGAHHIDAVEIDPEIAFLGQIFHPEQPYSDERVNLIIDDARIHMKNCKKKYDLIVYGLLDSHTLLGNLSNVRMDSFIYTVEAFKEARSLLKENGVLSLTFCLVNPKQGRKVFIMLETAFDGQKPICYQTIYDGGYTFLTGPGVKGASSYKAPDSLILVTERFSDPTLKADPSTDDWPFFYMPSRIYPKSYLYMVILLAAISFFLIRRYCGMGARFFDGQFFLLGAGFMLIETKGITELGLHFGNTWHVITFVIAAILLFAFIANYVVYRTKKMHAGVCYLFLLALLGAEFFFGLSQVRVHQSHFISKYYALIILTIPLFFSGMIFSRELQKKRDIPTAMASNLFGAMAGGFLEYNAMYTGYHSLAGYALVIYLGACVCFLFRRD